MLPKIWKKLLLAICIIACLFNVTAKLVNRISLEKVIASEQEGVDIKELLNITDEQPVVTKNTNSVSNYNSVETKPIVEEYEPEQNDNIENEEINSEEQPIEENNEENPENEEDSNFMNRIFETSTFSDIMGN